MKIAFLYSLINQLIYIELPKKTKTKVIKNMVYKLFKVLIIPIYSAVTSIYFAAIVILIIRIFLVVINNITIYFEHSLKLIYPNRSTTINI